MPGVNSIHTARFWQSCSVLISIALLLGALLAALWTLLVWYKFHPHMPWRDTLPLLRQMAPIFEGSYGTAELLALLEPHYTAHRVLVPRLLLLLDLRWFGGQSHLLFAAGWAAMGLLLLLHGRLAAAYFRASHGIFLASLALPALFLFSPAHLWNLLNPLNSSWHLSIALAMLAFYCLLVDPARFTPARVVSAYSLLLLAAFSNFSGLLAWILLPVLFVLARHRYAGWAFLASVLFVLVYSAGVSSDADIALSMVTGLPQTEAVRDMTENAHTVIAQNNLWRVSLRTIDLLTWPLSREQQLWPRVLVVCSVFALAAAWLMVLRNWWLCRPRLHPWIEFCLLGATLCLGIATSVQLGRLLPYPDEIHGPSPERYQTFIVLYWGYCSGLALTALSFATGRRQALALGLIAVLAAALVLPPAAVLRKELKSAEYAGSLFLVGEQPALKPISRGMAASFTADYALAFDRLFARHQLAYHLPVQRPPSAETLPTCEQAGVRISRTEALAPLAQIIVPNHHFQQLSARVDNGGAMLVRDILIFDGQRLAGRLSPRHQGDYSPAQLLRGDHYEWAGGYVSTAMGEAWLTVSVNTLLGSPTDCRIRPAHDNVDLLAVLASRALHGSSLPVHGN